jgi:hypothetical protein
VFQSARRLVSALLPIFCPATANIPTTMKLLFARILLPLLVLFLAGCGQTSHHFIQSGSETTAVSFDVMLDKPFVSSVSSIGGGQAAMLILVGPFTNNAVLLVAKENTPIGEKVAFRERLKWGHNSFNTTLARNTTYHLVVAVQGTRSGFKEIGTVQTGAGGAQHVTVTLLENEVSVK